MNRLFAGYLVCLKAIIVLGFSAQFAISSVFAAAVPTMLSIPTQTIVAEQPFSYLIMAGAAGQPVGVRLINAPKGATVTDNGDSSHEFRWTPPADVGEQTVIIVQAFSHSDPSLVSTQRVLFQRASAKQVQAAAPVVSTSVVVASNTAVGSRFLTPAANSTTATATASNATSNATSVTAETPTKIEAKASNTTSTGYKSKFKTKPTVSVAAIENKPTTLNNSIEPGSSTAVSNALAAITTPSSNISPAASTAPTEIVANNTETTVTDRPELPKLGLQRLTVGEDFEFFIRPVAADNAQVQLSAESLPVGATFEDVFEGSKMLRWTPTADQVGGHKILLVLVAQNATAPSLRTEREVMFVVAPAPPVEREPELELEPISAQIVSAGRKVNIKVEPKVSDDKLALLQVDRLPTGGSFDENKDGTRTFHWPTTQADQGEHTFRFTAIHPDNPELVANVNVLIVVGSPDGPASGPANIVVSENASPSPELDTYPSADSPPPSATLPSPSAALPSPESPPSVDSPSPEPYPSADTASPEPLAVRPSPQPRPTPD